MARRRRIRRWSTRSVGRVANSPVSRNFLALSRVMEGVSADAIRDWPVHALRTRARGRLHHCVAHSAKHPNGFGRRIPDSGANLATPPPSPTRIEHNLSPRDRRDGELAHQYLKDAFDAWPHACSAPRGGATPSAAVGTPIRGPAAVSRRPERELVSRGRASHTCEAPHRSIWRHGAGLGHQRLHAAPRIRGNRCRSERSSREGR